MPLQFSQLLPADGWFFIHANVPGQQAQGEFTMYRLIAFCVQVDNALIGVIPRALPSESDTDYFGTVPPVPGYYKHINDFNQAEKTALKAQSPALEAEAGAAPSTWP